MGNEILIIVHPADKLDDIIETSVQINKIGSVTYVVFEFNGCKIFVKKGENKEDIKREYYKKLKS